MLVSTFAFKVAVSALLALMVILFIDGANGTFNTRSSPLWIALPGALAFVTAIAALMVGGIAFVWGL